MTPFYGRQRELQLLKELLSKKTASLVVIKGRRRVGKSRLAKEFSSLFSSLFQTGKTCTLVGLPPEKKVTAQMQRDHFANGLQRQLSIPGLKGTDDWSDLFWHLANYAKQGRFCIILDEINWMGSKDPAFLGKLKTAWDELFKENPQLILILSGSMSAWINKNIIHSTGYLGRVSLDLTLHELSLPMCNYFWDPHAERVSPIEKFKVLSVTGGIPRYLEEIHPEWSAKKNIQKLCFQKEGLLFLEFDKIFADLFSTKGTVYKQILRFLVRGSADMAQICDAIGVQKGGTISEYLSNLAVTGYVSHDQPWDLSTGRSVTPSIFRLSDNYIRFYLKYIDPIKERIQREGTFDPPAWDTILGLQFENLVLQNRRRIYEKLQISASEIVNENPYIQTTTTTRKGCQIDYLIQTRYDTLYVCEIKFSKRKIGTKVIEEMQSKIDRLQLPRRFSIRPVLIHVNGVSDQVTKTGFFTHLIDFGDFLEPPSEIS